MEDPIRWLEFGLGILIFLIVWFSAMHFNTVKKILIGRPMRTEELHNKANKLFWWMALPILSADMYSSVAYAPESGITELESLGPDAKWLILPITLSTIILLAILISSYIMGILAYPNGGGAYAISKNNFKHPWIWVVASSSLLLDYVLTVAVSVSAAIEAVASAYPAVEGFKTTLALLCVLFLVIVNLRGVAEAAKMLAWPTFAFMGGMIVLIAAGFINEIHHGFVQPTTPAFGTIPHGLTMLLILKAFSSACSALTGIETISNSVPIFREPQQKNAIKTYIALGIIAGVTLLGFVYHLYVKGISVNPHNTMLSQLAASYFGHSWFYQILIWLTFIVLILAANATFNGFSQLAAIVAADGFLPRSLANRGDRLAYSNGIVLLAALASFLIAIFRAHTGALIPLYAIGVFVSFTVAQIGLVRRWHKVKGTFWKGKMTINLIGAVLSAVVAFVFAVTKFTGGAWIVLVVLPLLILFSLAIHRHYDAVAEQLRINYKTDRPEAHRVTSIVLVSGIHRVVKNTLSFAKSLGTDCIAVYVAFDDASADRMRKQWEAWGQPCELIILKSQYRSILGPISQFLREMEKNKKEGDYIHIILPQFILKKWWHNLLHNQSALLLRAWLFRHKDLVITTVPFHLKK